MNAKEAHALQLPFTSHLSGFICLYVGSKYNWCVCVCMYVYVCVHVCMHMALSCLFFSHLCGVLERHMLDHRTLEVPEAQAEDGRSYVTRLCAIIKGVSNLAHKMHQKRVCPYK